MKLPVKPSRTYVIKSRVQSGRFGWRVSKLTTALTPLQLISLMNLEIPECLAVGSGVFARWNTINKHTRYFHGFITKIRKTSVEITPSGNYGARVNRIIELPRAEKRLVIIDKQSKPSEINLGAEVIVASQDRIGFSQGQVTQRFGTWYGVDVGNRRMVWKMARDIRLLINPIYCDRE